MKNNEVITYMLKNNVKLEQEIVGENENEKKKTLTRIRKFTEDRHWGKFHSPANLAKSISIEASELLECFQWDGTEIFTL